MLLLVQVASYVRLPPLLGVAVGTIDNELAEKLGYCGGGLHVFRVIGGSDAENVGIREHDVILEVDGHAVARPADLQDLLSAHAPGDGVELNVWRGGEIRTFKVKLGTCKAGAGRKATALGDVGRAWLGVGL